MKENESVIYGEFINELQMEYEYHLNGGTFYRQETTRLSILVTEAVGDVAPFMERESAVTTVKRILPRENTDRQTDVSEMLFHIARDMYRKRNMPKEMKNEIEKRKRKIITNKISLIRVEKEK